MDYPTKIVILSGTATAVPGGSNLGRRALLSTPRSRGERHIGLQHQSL